jgi:hypothetical protein
MRNAQQIASDLRSAVDEGVRLLSDVPESLTTVRAVEGEWCAREIVGHLIDSACNNHRRFIVNQTLATLSVEPYEQNDWITRQRYAEEPFADLVALWAAYNRHLAHVIEAMPDDVLCQPRGPAAGRGFAYVPVDSATASIALLAQDYVGHIRHHFRQLQRLPARA